MNDGNIPLVQASLIPARGQIKIQVMPGVTDPVLCLMQVASACVNAAQGKLTEERTKPIIERAPPGMRVPRSD